MFVVNVNNSWRPPEDNYISYRKNIELWHDEWATWLAENCSGDWDMTLNNNDGGCSTNVSFEFEDEAVAFKIAWDGRTYDEHRSHS